MMTTATNALSAPSSGQPVKRLSRTEATPWQSIAAQELLTHGGSPEGMSELLPECSAIYCWRVRLELDTPPTDVSSFVAHLRRVSELPQGRLGAVSLSRAVAIDGMTLGGAGLTPEKLEFFRRFLGNPARARWLASFLKSLQLRLPALYVGRASNLAARVGQHVREETDFGRAVENDEVLDWRYLNLEYLELGQANEVKADTLEALEQLFTVLSLASFTKRAG